MSHTLIAWFLVASNFVAGAWCVAKWRRAELYDRYLEHAIAIAHIGFFIQGITGVILFNRVGETADDFHLFYGFFSMAFVGFLYAYRFQLKSSGWYYRIYGFGCLFLSGMALRTIYLPAVVS